MENSNTFLDQVGVSEEQLPAVISETLSNIVEFDQKIKTAVINAKDLADKAEKKDAGWSLFGRDKKEAIEALQKAMVCQAQVLSDTIDANESLFKNQQQMARGMRCLFGLGVASIAANRSVVSQLEHKLRSASQEELSEMAREEIRNVILQLRAREDMYQRIENVEKILCEHKQMLAQIKETNDEIIKLSKYTQHIQPKISFFDTKFYKILVLLVAVTAVAVSILL